MRRNSWVWIALVLATSACATTPFPYDHYNLYPDGSMLGEKADGSDDHNISECGTKQGGSRCTVIFNDTVKGFNRMRKDYDQAVRDLATCQKKVGN